MAELETFVPSKHNRPIVLAGSRLDLQFVSVTAMAEKNSAVRTNRINALRAELGAISGRPAALAPENILLHQAACICSSRALTSRFPIFRTAAMIASCSAFGRVVPASQL